jgi:hypothetical protein
VASRARSAWRLVLGMLPAEFAGAVVSWAGDEEDEGKQE